MVESYCQLWVRKNCQPRHIHHSSDFPWEIYTPVWSHQFHFLKSDCPGANQCCWLLSQATVPASYSPRLEKLSCAVFLSPHHFLSYELILVLPLEYSHWSEYTCYHCRVAQYKVRRLGFDQDPTIEKLSYLGKST